MRTFAGIACWIAIAAAPALAQEATPPHQHDTMNPAWQWSVEGSAFAGYNYQWRKFTDFDEVESQNWLMAALQKSFGSSSLNLVAMFSLEPFTLRDLGSPQVFQTGETFNGAPLIDYQHPHDLIMNLGGEYSWLDRGDAGGVRRGAGADRSGGVHAPPIGDRESASAVVASLSRRLAHHARGDLDWCRAIGIQARSGRFSWTGTG